MSSCATCTSPLDYQRSAIPSKIWIKFFDKYSFFVYLQIVFVSFSNHDFKKNLNSNNIVRAAVSYDNVSWGFSSGVWSISCHLTEHIGSFADETEHNMFSFMRQNHNIQSVSIQREASQMLFTDRPAILPHQGWWRIEKRWCRVHDSTLKASRHDRVSPSVPFFRPWRVRRIS